MDMQNVLSLVIPEGSVRTIHDKNSRLLWGRVNYNTKYAGDTIQNGTPTPDAPAAVNVVTGTQTVTITDGNTQSQAYTISLGSIELCKISTYQDYLYKSGDDWYVHKKISKVELTGEESWALLSVNTRRAAYYSALDDMEPYINGNSLPNFISDRFIQNTGNSTWTAGVISGEVSRPTFVYLCVQNNITTVGDFQNWLSTHNTTVYYVLNTPTDTKITNAALVGQLDAINQFLTRYGYGVTVSGNLPIIIDRTNL